MADTIIDGTLFNVNNIMYTTPKANEKGGKSLTLLNKTTKTGLRVSTPLMLTWGASEYVDPEGKGNGKYEMSLQFPQEEYSNADCDAFLKNMVALENKIKADALVYSKDWFGKQHKNSDIIDELFTPMLKYPKIKGSSEPDFNKKPILRLKMPQWDGAWKSEIYDEDGNKLFPSRENVAITPLDFLKKGATVACLIQCGGIWFTNGKFTITWKLLQAVVQKPRATIQGQCMIKLKTADKEKLKAAPAPPEEDIEDGLVAQVEDTDDEEEPVVVVETVFVTPTAQTVTPTPAVTVAVSREEEEVSQVEEIKPKKKIVRKKAE